MFPQARVFDASAFLRVAMGRHVDGMPDGAEVVLYLGGDLMHAARLHRRLGGAFATYKFSRPKYAARTAAAFAVDAQNARQLHAWGVPRDRIAIAGNLAIDGAFDEANAPAEAGAPAGGILFMPGSRRHEVRHLVPFFFAAALAIRREAPRVPIAFGISPFTAIAELREAIEAGGDARFYARRGKVVEFGGSAYLANVDESAGFPIVHNALAAARLARLAVTIPGTKAIELAALGIPAIACTPLNAPELVAINGPLTYLNRIPIVGTPLKRAVVTRFAAANVHHTQPNIDGGRAVLHELHGTLTPGRVARVALERLNDESWLETSSQALRALYAEHVGAADRMTAGLLQLAKDPI